MTSIKFIPVALIQAHPDNPRKDLGDLTELAESIRAKGILQNLTVVETGEDSYRVIIGHRRLAASKMAGVTEVPCVVADMDEQEQFETMMVENVQRSDLTVYEQAEGFQTMLDMGGTVESVAEKTGFSESTVRKRVKLLALDKQKFQKGEERGATMRDYLKLNEIRDEEVRNKVLDTIGTPNFANALASALGNQTRSDNMEAAREVLRTATWCTPFEDGDQADWVFCTGYNGAKPFVVPDDAGTTAYKYSDSVGYISLYRKRERTAGGVDPRKERFNQQMGQLRTEFQTMAEVHRKLRADFISNFSALNTYGEEIERFACQALLKATLGHHYINRPELASMLGIDPEKMDESFQSCLNNAQMCRKAMLVFSYKMMDSISHRYYKCDYGNNHISHEDCPALDELYKALKSLGYEMSDDEKKMQDGTHRLFGEAAAAIYAYEHGVDEDPAEDEDDDALYEEAIKALEEE